MVTPQTKYSKIAQFLKRPLDPDTAKIIGGMGGLLLGLGIAGGVVAYEHLSVASIAIIFIAFGYAGSMIGIHAIDYAARNSASLSTIIFAILGTDFAGPPGAIAATAFISFTNIALRNLVGMTIDEMFADGLVASINGVDQIVQDSQEAIADLPTKTKVVAHEHAKAKAVAVVTPQMNLPEKSQAIQQNAQQKQTNVSRKPKKTFTKKLEEEREVTQDAQLKR